MAKQIPWNLLTNTVSLMKVKFDFQAIEPIINNNEAFNLSKAVADSLVLNSYAVIDKFLAVLVNFTELTTKEIRFYERAYQMQVRLTLSCFILIQ